MNTYDIIRLVSWLAIVTKLKHEILSRLINSKTKLDFIKTRRDKKKLLAVLKSGYFIFLQSVFAEFWLQEKWRKPMLFEHALSSIYKQKRRFGIKKIKVSLFYYKEFNAFSYFKLFSCGREKKRKKLILFSMWSYLFHESLHRRKTKVM